MSFTITQTSFLSFFGVAVLAWAAGNIGSFCGILINMFRVKSLDGERFFVLAGLIFATLKLQFVKIPLALIVAVICMCFFPTVEVTAAAGACFVLGLALMCFIFRTTR